MNVNDVLKWSHNDWLNKVCFVEPTSEGGMGGVMLVWVQSRPPARFQFVIKPVAPGASPASTRFAEVLISKVAGAATPHSKGVFNATPGMSASSTAKSIQTVLNMFRLRETRPEYQARWAAVWDRYQFAGSYLIQEGLNIRTFEAHNRVELAGLLRDQKLMENLGKLFVADAIIGNGDRLCEVNAGNIAFQPDGSLAAIDSATVLISYEQAKANNPGISIQDWSTSAVLMERAGQINAGTQRGLVEADMEYIFKPENWWNRKFKPALVKAMQDKLPSTATAVDRIGPTPPVWNDAYAAFHRGYEAAMNELDSQLSGLNWLLVKRNYQKYVGKYGGDPNLDWTNFKIRRRYFKLRRKNLDDATALQAIREYAQGKLGD
ncbi:MAG: hypothetical protein ABSH20_22430 [Tepidisphaeraceae bacterium]|jgi:hypothetical protein